MPKKNSKALLLRPYLYLNDFNTINQKALSGLLQALIQPVFEIKDDVCQKIYITTLHASCHHGGGGTGC